MLYNIIKIIFYTHKYYFLEQYDCSQFLFFYKNILNTEKTNKSNSL
jgi:hypothetical protein